MSKITEYTTMDSLIEKMQKTVIQKAPETVPVEIEYADGTKETIEFPTVEERKRMNEEVRELADLLRKVLGQ